MKDKLRSIGKATFIVFGLIANAASICGFWISYISASADFQVRFARMLGFVGAIIAGGAYLFLAWMVLYRKEPHQQVARPLSAEDILIFTPGPGLYLNRQRSHAEIQIGIFSTAPVELLYVEAKVLCDSAEIATLERNKPVAIPKLNPQTQMIEKSLTEKELQRFDRTPGTFFRVAGFAKFRGPKNEGLNVFFGFQTAAWWLPVAQSATPNLRE